MLQHVDAEINVFEALGEVPDEQVVLAVGEPDEYLIGFPARVSAKQEEADEKVHPLRVPHSFKV